MTEPATPRPESKYIPLRRPGGFGPHNQPVQKPRNFRATMLRLWRSFGREKRPLLMILFFVLVDAVILLAIPFLTGRAVDKMTGGPGTVPFNEIQLIIVVLLAVYLGDWFFNLLNNVLMAGVSQRIVKELRRSLFAKLQKLPIAYFDTNTHGDIMSRLTNDIDNISSTLSSSTVSLMADVIAIAGSLAAMLLLNPLLTLASLVTAPLVLLLSRTIASRTQVLFKEQQTVLGQLNGYIEESISGLQVVKAFNHEAQVISEFSQTNQALFAVGLKAQIISGYLMPMMNIIGNIGFAVVAVSGGILAVKNLITVGVIASFLGYSKQFTRPLNDVANLFNTLQTAIAGAERIFEVLDTEAETPDQPDAVVLARPRGEIEFQNVSFAYRPGVPVLKNVSFSAKAGSNIAIVGPTGAGKTTIVNLVNRFYDVSGGRIMLDGRDIRTYTRASLASSFGIVLQETYLFASTVRENIRYGRLDASNEEIEQVAAQAGADEFIRKLENGYDTLLAENGSNLSQGQRQLIAIARAILTNPAILILDEATSNVDTRTELKIQQTMVELMRGRTCFIIAHRLSTIRKADLILVIDDGQVVESGSQADLLAKKGTFYKLYQSQYQNIQT
jgi:ATP-binding cassette subfamily B multidrug efflux pump